MAIASSPLKTLPEISSDILEEGRHVLRLEGGALLMLSQSLDTSFEKAIFLLEKTQGKVVLCGLGKSGHISRKIASTLASTGTPAFFLHPSEASHGDLGMLSQNDTLIVVSNSGETAELAHIITHSRQHHISMIAITAFSESSLAQAADLVLELPQAPEACPFGLAPTTSTTLTLALGDALAVVLLKRKRFQRSDYGVLHPGGSLGRRLLKVSQLMRKGAELPCVQMGTLMKEALFEMTGKGFGCVGVLNAQEQLQGIITDGDLRRHMAPDLLEQPVEAIMTKKPLTISADLLALEALTFMNEKGITMLFVVEHNRRIQGLLRLHDCLKGKLI